MRTAFRDKLQNTSYKHCNVPRHVVKCKTLVSYNSQCYWLTLRGKLQRGASWATGTLLHPHHVSERTALCCKLQRKLHCVRTSLFASTESGIVTGSNLLHSVLCACAPLHTIKKPICKGKIQLNFM